MSNAVIPAAELALFDADKPVLVGKNDATQIKTGAVAYPAWEDEPDYTLLAGDDAASGYDSVFGIDGYSHKTTRYGGVATTIYYHNATTSPASNEIDCAFILNHNFATISATVTLALYDGSYLDVETWTPGTDDRMVSYDLLHTGSTPRRYTNVSAWRLQIDWSGSGDAPEFGEVILGRRRQLKIYPLLPYDPLPIVSDVTSVRSAGGVETRYAFNTGRRRLNAILAAHEDDRISDIEAFFTTDTSYMSLPFLYCEKPKTTPEDTMWMAFDDYELNGPIDEFVDRRFALNAQELGPHYLSTEG